MDFGDHENPEYAQYVPSPEDIASAREKADALEAAAQKLGLYLQTCDLGTASGPDGTLRMVIIAQLATGDITWTDRILRPEVADINDEFIQMSTKMDEEAFEEYKAKIERRMRGEDDDGDE